MADRSHCITYLGDNETYRLEEFVELNQATIDTVNLIDTIALPELPPHIVESTVVAVFDEHISIVCLDMVPREPGAAQYLKDSAITLPKLMVDGSYHHWIAPQQFTKQDTITVGLDLKHKLLSHRYQNSVVELPLSIQNDLVIEWGHYTHVLENTATLPLFLSSEYEYAHVPERFGRTIIVHVDPASLFSAQTTVVVPEELFNITLQRKGDGSLEQITLYQYDDVMLKIALQDLQDTPYVPQNEKYVLSVVDNKTKATIFKSALEPLSDNILATRITEEHTSTMSGTYLVYIQATASDYEHTVATGKLKVLFAPNPRAAARLK